MEIMQGQDDGKIGEAEKTALAAYKRRRWIFYNGFYFIRWRSDGVLGVASPWKIDIRNFKLRFFSSHDESVITPRCKQ